MNVERLFQTIAEIAGERFGATVKVKEVRDESVVRHCPESFAVLMPESEFEYLEETNGR